jgi:hypothetical protein
MKTPERGGRGNAQAPAGRVLLPRNARFRIADRGEDADYIFVKGLARMGERQAARCAVDEARA